MFSHNHYVPILKSKKGEFDALKNLSSNVRDTLTPMIDVLAVDWDHKNNKPKCELDEHLDKVAKNIKSSWVDETPIFVDVYWIDLDERVDGKVHPVEYIFNCLRSEMDGFIPVTGLDRDSNFQKAVAKIISKDKRGVCVRIQNDDLEDIEVLREDLEGIISLLDVDIQDIHIVIDLRSIRKRALTPLASSLIESINCFPNINEYKTLTVTASSMPQSLSECIKTGETDSISRDEMSLWLSVLQSEEKLKRIPAFGDYGVSHPDYVDLDGRTIGKNLSPSIRYAIEDSWLILRGIMFRKHPEGYKQYHDLSKDLVDRAEYYDEKFSWGDGRINKCATYQTGPGSMAQWVAHNTNHHIVATAKQVANAVLP